MNFGIFREAPITRSKHAVPISFEVYPPRNPEGFADLQDAIRALDQTGPEFISVTFGAGGFSTRQSLEVLTYIRDKTESIPLAHVTCVGTSTKQASELVKSFLDAKITHFLALRGDLPEGHTRHDGELQHATDLVELIHRLGAQNQEPISVSVAAFPNGHPESNNTQDDIDNLLRKQDAGASLAISQLFFYSADYERFVEKARKGGVTIPILPGLMPITSVSRLARVLELTGENRPKQLAHSLEMSDNVEDRSRAGIEWTAGLVKELVEMGAPGIHLYAFNQHATVLSVLEQAGVR